MKIIEKKMTNREYIKQNNISTTEEYDAFFFSTFLKRRLNRDSRNSYKSLNARDRETDKALLFWFCQRAYYKMWVNETYDGWTLKSVKKKKQAWLSKEETNAE